MAVTHRLRKGEYERASMFWSPVELPCQFYIRFRASYDIPKLSGTKHPCRRCWKTAVDVVPYHRHKRRSQDFCS